MPNVRALGEAAFVSIRRQLVSFVGKGFNKTMEKFLLYGLESTQAEEIEGQLKAENIDVEILQGEELVAQSSSANWIIGSSSAGHAELLQQLHQKENKNVYVLLQSEDSNVSPEEAFDRGATASFREPIDIFRVSKSIESLLQLKLKSFPFRSPRYWSKQEVKIESAAHKMSGQILNISRGGFYGIFSEWPYGAHDILAVQIQKTADLNIQMDLSAEVRWQKRGLSRWEKAEEDEVTREAVFDIGVGFQFRSLDEKDHSAIDQLLLLLEGQMIYPVFS